MLRRLDVAVQFLQACSVCHATAPRLHAGEHPAGFRGGAAAALAGLTDYRAGVHDALPSIAQLYTKAMRGEQLAIPLQYAIISSPVVKV